VAGATVEPAGGSACDEAEGTAVLVPLPLVTEVNSPAVAAMIPTPSSAMPPVRSGEREPDGDSATTTSGCGSGRSETGGHGQHDEYGAGYRRPGPRPPA
jgi:hypothetical protein